MSGEHEAVEKIDVQTIWFQSKRVLRTVVQVVIGAATVLTVVVVVAPQVLEAIADVVPGPVLAWLTGAVATLAAVSAALTKIMAIPKVNELLTLIGLGSVPKTVAVETAAAKSQELQPAQFEPSTTDLRTEQSEPKP
ncbi:hypothetical protein NYS48_09770 [Curtobacterium flaccumfaciens pv. flaccumfaciens]|uniref:hypothetical protein n=1 Tax=Curtobacterium poinsettiae TaxID=159612 RepID=UPI00217DE8EF|nr:hypothetical protein [Curtobacterium flaccumfaciens]MCS6565600.1 hypothetical protein [Curtobacterium flaccumfaciens pv. flaccumfaciens]